MPFQFNDHYDRDSGYRTKSLLTLPMRNAKGEVLGVLQLINAKHDPAAQFAQRSGRGRASAAVPAAIGAAALCRWRLRRLWLTKIASSITIFKRCSKVLSKAAVTAIEQRDPTTSGHSLRVAAYTEGLAEVVDQHFHRAIQRDSRFDLEQMKEIRYAALAARFRKSRSARGSAGEGEKTVSAANGTCETALRLHSQGTGSEHGAPQAANFSGARSRRCACRNRASQRRFRSAAGAHRGIS